MSVALSHRRLWARFSTLHIQLWTPALEFQIHWEKAISLRCMAPAFPVLSCLRCRPSLLGRRSLVAGTSCLGSVLEGGSAAFAGSAVSLLSPFLGGDVGIAGQAVWQVPVFPCCMLPIGCASGHLSVYCNATALGRTFPGDCSKL